jgi:hypothetical protein
VDDFGVQYVGKEHSQHLIDALKIDYTISKDCTGGLYCGINLKWNYENKHVDLSNHGYIKDSLHKYQHPMPKRPQYAPHKWTVPAYGQRIQYAPLPDAPPQQHHKKSHVPKQLWARSSTISRRRPNPSCALEHSSIKSVNIHINNHIYCLTYP